MSHGPEEINYGRKAGCLGFGFIGLFLFIIMLIWIYNKNFQGIPS